MNYIMESAGNQKNKIVILIEDGSFLYDNRVKHEAIALTEAGFQVFVICPKYPGEKSYSEYKGVRIYRYCKWTIGAHLGEYSSSLLKGGLLIVKVWNKYGGFHCIQACNPPDLWFIIAWFFKRIFNVKFVFDHHDVCPELLVSRYGHSKKSFIFKIMLLMEKLTFRLSDAVLSTNESYKEIAMHRGRVSEEKIVVVRNGPDLNKFKANHTNVTEKGKGLINVGYLGNMNPQDGVDYLIKVARYIVHKKDRKEFRFILIGKGDSFNNLVRLTEKYGLSGYIDFKGRIPDDEMLDALSLCDICVQPDPRNLLNEISTMNKLMEYMALGKATVAFDLKETRYSGGNCILYAKPNDIEDMAKAIIKLADDQDLRMKLGKMARKRIEKSLAWEYSVKNLVGSYQKLFRTS